MHGPNGHWDEGEDGEEDAVLVARTRRDPAAFGPLYDRYVGPIYRYCLHRLGSRAEAEDATGAVFAKALAALPAYQSRHEPGGFRSWLFAIAHNTVADAYRRAGSTRALGDADDRPDPDPQPDECVLAAEERATLHALLARLPPEQRRVMELRLSGVPSPEVARIVGRSPQAVRSLQHRAVVRLREILAAEAATEETHGRR